MKEDIEFPPVKGVHVAIARETATLGGFTWMAYLINSNEYPIVNVLVATKGYGELDGQEHKTSVLRHLIERVEPGGKAPIELMDPTVFALVNEFWVSYYRDEPGSDIYDKKFLFLPDSIVEANITYIRELDAQGVLHG